MVNQSRNSPSRTGLKIPRNLNGKVEPTGPSEVCLRQTPLPAVLLDPYPTLEPPAPGKNSEMTEFAEERDQRARHSNNKTRKGWESRVHVTSGPGHD